MKKQRMHVAEYNWLILELRKVRILWNTSRYYVANKCLFFISRWLVRKEKVTEMLILQIKCSEQCTVCFTIQKHKNWSFSE